MDDALYHPEHGFYAAHGNAGGRRGDFTTSPEVGPLFGSLMAEWVVRRWRDCGAPPVFDVVEVGAGRGVLAVSLAHALEARDDTSPVDWRFHLVERSARLSDEHAALDIAGLESSSTLPGPFDAGVVIANELLDNVAWRVVQSDGGRWREQLVDDDGRVCPGDIVSDDRLAGIVGEPGRSLPLVDDAAALVERMCRVVRQGAVLCVDYGVERTVELLDRRWCRTYAGHERGFDPFDAPGRRDITIDVPFDQLPPPTTLRRQADALADWGLAARVEEGRRIWAERAHIGDLSALRARSRVAEAQALTDPQGLGAFWVAEWTIGADPRAGDVSVSGTGRRSPS